MARRVKHGMATRAVHVGHEADVETGAVSPPIHQTSTFLYPKRKDARGRWTKATWFYTRRANPTVDGLERKLASLEGAEKALAFSSGMAAVSTSVLAHVGAGMRVVAMADIYGGTLDLFNRQMPELGVKVRLVRKATPQKLVDACDRGTRLVYVETPTNPFNRCLDLPALARGLRKRFGAKRPPIVVDATLASPVNFRPLAHGADLVLHSATKYLNGHSDIIGGMVAGSRRAIAPLEPWLYNLGAVMDPHQAFLVSRGMRTLTLRMRAHNSNAERIAEFLARHPKVKRVWHLSRPDHPDRAVARRLLDGYGGIVTIELKSKRANAGRKFVEGLEFFQVAPSLGGVESLVSIPVETSHKYLSPSERRAAGISPSVVRLAVGIEDSEDLEADLGRALSGVS